MIEESYVSFDTAKLLKEAGFDEWCCYGYNKDGNKTPLSLKNSTIEEMFNSIGDEWYVSAPTQALAARWLREVHRISVDAAFMAPSTNIDVWQYFIGKMDDMIWPGDFETCERTYATYEEAMEAGLQEAIKLIKK